MRYGLGGALYFFLIFYLHVPPGILQGLDILDSGEVVYIQVQTKGVVGRSVILECGPTLPNVYIWGYTIPGTEHIRAVVFNFGQGPKLQSLAKTLGDLNVITNTASLLIEKLPLAAQGLYTCQALYDTPQGAKLIYYYVQLLVLVPVSKPYILVSDSSPAEGTHMSMRCGLDNGTGPIKYIWERESRDSTPISFAEDSVDLLNITNINRNHTGWYQCLAANEVNNQRSDRIWLNVIFGPDVPRIDVTPYSVTERGYSALERATVSLMCQASSNPPSQYVWFYNNSQVHTGQQYNITKILRMHSGHYSCLAQNYYLNTNSKTTITLYVYYPPNGSPTCTLLPSNNYTDVVLWCSWEGGYPPASLYWSSPLISPNGVEPSLINATLVHPGSRTPHNSTFTCHGSHVASPASYSCSTTALLPSGEPQCYTYATRNNEYLMLSCSWEGGFPRALLWWSLNNGSLLGSSEENANILILKSSATYSGKAFVCHAKHPLSSASKKCVLRLEAPVLVTQRSLVSVYEGNDIQLSCILKANNPVTEIIWFNNHKKQVGNAPSKYLLYGEATWSNLTVREADGMQDSGQYWCSASNAVGGAEIPITVLIKRYPVPPNVTISKIKYSSQQRTEVDLQWAVKETGNLTGFIVERLKTQELQLKVNDTFSWVQLVTGIQPDVRYHRLVGLDPTSIYVFRILAINHRTLGYPSEVKTPADPPFNAYPAVIGAAIGGMIAATLGTMLLFIYIVRNRNTNPRLHDMLFGMQHSQSRENINSPEDEVVSRSQSEGELEDPTISPGAGPAVVSGSSMSAEPPAAEGDDNEPVNVTITVTATT
ncbi:V-set and immunoglobulin domain-containing protein 10-like 2 [Scleropages formosus]|uniref:V-set and immunoglobulin domain-containing protein 10-like 2 n=1 Tax=Scleropages formosus TaxID=113540 RepID=UPI0010FA84BE|nr:V-set and immunoglobulin domain-containing protein 10-like 2 [Scleropages formosus]